MSILAAYLATLGSSPTVSISNLLVVAIGFSTQTASYTLQADGDIISAGTIVVDQGDWIVPKSAASGVYETRATVVSGSLTTGVTGTWLSLDSDRTWSLVRNSVGSSQCVLTIEIRKGTTVLTSATITLEAEVTDFGGF